MSIERVKRPLPLALTVACLAANVTMAAACWRRGASVAPAPAVSEAPRPPPPPPAPQSIPPDRGVTAKVRPPPEVLAVSDAFANAAAAIRPSVVRLDVEEMADPSSLTESSPREPGEIPNSLRRFYIWARPWPRRRASRSTGPARGSSSTARSTC